MIKLVPHIIRDIVLPLFMSLTPLVSGELSKTGPKWKVYNEMEYYVELHQSGNHQMAVDACHNMSGRLVMLKNVKVQEVVEGLIPYLAPYGRLIKLEITICCDQ